MDLAVLFVFLVNTPIRHLTFLNVEDTRPRFHKWCRMEVKCTVKNEYMSQFFYSDNQLIVLLITQ